MFHSSPRRRVLDKHCLRALSARRSLLSEGLRMRAPSQPPVQPPGAPLHTRRALVKQKRPFFSTPSCLYTNGFSACNALSFLTPYLSAQFFFISSLKIKKKKFKLQLTYNTMLVSGVHVVIQHLYTIQSDLIATVSLVILFS